MKKYFPFEVGEEVKIRGSHYLEGKEGKIVSYKNKGGIYKVRVEDVLWAIPGKNLRKLGEGIKIGGTD